ARRDDGYASASVRPGVRDGPRRGLLAGRALPGRLERRPQGAVWDLTTGKQKWYVGFADAPNPRVGMPAVAAGGDDDTIFTAAVSPGGRLIVFGTQNGLIVFHDLITGHELRRVENLPDGVNALSFSPDGRTLAWSADRDPKLHLMEVATGKERHVL